MQAQDAAKPVAVFALLLGVWVVTYWLYEPGGPPITFATASTFDTPAPKTAVPAPAPLPPSDGDDPLVRVRALQPPRFTTYTVQIGDDSFGAIARKTMGDARFAEQIARANPLVSPDRLVAGRTVLRIPEDPLNIQGREVEFTLPHSRVPQPWQQHAEPVAPPPPPGSRWPTNDQWHNVKAGESLSKIGARYYSSPNGYMKIYEANRDQLSSPDRLKAGMRLKIPKGP